MKIFEYMSSGRPIITTPLNSIKEVLSHKSALFVNPDDSEAIVRAIGKIEKEPEFAQVLAENARKEVLEFSWQKRAEGIINFIF